MKYHAPDTLDDAIALLGEEPGAVRLLAGGTDVLVQMHSDLVDPALLVDVKGIAEMRQVTETNGTWRVGAAVTGKELMDHPRFAAAWPGVMDGVRLIGSLQVRGRATMGGNLCNASPAADSVPPLIAADATVTIAGSSGRRDVPVEDIVTDPGQTCLAKDDVLVTFNLPARKPRSGDAYLRFTPRTEMDIAVVGAAVNLTLAETGECTDARVSLGAVAPRPLLVSAAAEALIGTTIGEADLEAMAQAARSACRPIDDKRGTIEFRTEVAGVLTRRATEIALERAKS